MSRFFANIADESSSEEEQTEKAPAPPIPEEKEEEVKPKEEEVKEKKVEEIKEEEPAKKKKKKKRKKKDKEKEKERKKANKPLSKAAQLAKQRIEKKKALAEQQRKEEERIRLEEDKERIRLEEEEKINKIKEEKEQERLRIQRELRKRAKKKKDDEIKRKRREEFQRQQEDYKKQIEEKKKMKKEEAEKKEKEEQENELKETEKEATKAEAEVKTKRKKTEEIEEGGSGEEFDFSGEDWEANLEQVGGNVENLKEELDKKNLIEKEKKEQKEKELKKRKQRKKKQKKKHKYQEEENVVAEVTNEKVYSDPNQVFYLKTKYRCPIICILGHVDTGKTKLLDKIRHTKVQDGEEGGITQQIGASFFPQYKLIEEITKLEKTYRKIPMDVPGLLIIDTPGHESFANLRKRGESLCDFAILVVDIKHGLENQTIESLNLLKERGTPFVIALNKIDTTAEWKHSPDGCSMANIKNQSGYSKMIFEENYKPIITQLGQNNINGCLYWEEHDEDYVCMVPTSAITGEGIPDILGFLVESCQKQIPDRITPDLKSFTCTVMEVKKIEGIGTTIDVILVNGELSEGDKIVLSGFQGPITTSIRALLTPQPLKELRVKSDYIHHKKLGGAMGFKIVAPGLETSIAGSQLFKYSTEEECDEYKEQLLVDIKRIKKKFKFKKLGVGVAASTLGSLEALLVFLRSKKIPVSYVCIGDITKEDIMKAMTPLLSEENQTKKKEFATILAFDVKTNNDALNFARMNEVKIINKKIIYHLCDDFMKYVVECKEARKKKFRKLAMFPVILKPIKFFNKKDPIIMGATVARGVLKMGSKLCIPSKDMLMIGEIISIESNHKNLEEARKKDGEIAVKIKCLKKELTAGRQFDISDNLVSMLTRTSVDCLKDFFRDEMRSSDWDLVRDLKKVFKF